MTSFLARRDLIAHAAKQLATNRRDTFALNLLIEFDALDRETPDAMLSPDDDALRASLRRIVTGLLAGDAGALDADIATLRGLTGVPYAPKRKPRRVRTLLVLVLAVGVGVGGGVAGMMPALQESDRKLEAADDQTADLQERIAEVANEKARAQDDKEYAAAAAKQLAEVATFAARITDDLELCIRYGNDVIDIAIDIGKGYTFNERELDRFLDSWAEVCGRARADAAALRDYVNQ